MQRSTSTRVVQRFFLADGADAAGHALAARLLAEEARDALRRSARYRAFVEEHHDARAERRAGRARILERQRHRRAHRARRTRRPRRRARIACSVAPPRTPPASSISARKRRAVRHFVEARVARRAGEAEEPRAGRAFACRCAAYAAPPSSTIERRFTSVSTLLIEVGLPKSPPATGNGGLLRGSPRLPSIELKSAVSSPQMYAPAPRRISMSKRRPLPITSSPSSPPARAASIACCRRCARERILAAHVDVAVLAADGEARRSSSPRRPRTDRAPSARGL